MEASFSFLRNYITEPIYALWQSRHNRTPATEIERSVTLFSDLYLNEEKSDVTIVIDNVELPAHRDILVQRCRYFEALFNSGMIEVTSKRIEIRETSIDGFKSVLQYIYTGAVEFTSINSTFDALRLAQMYELENEFEDLAVDFLKDACTVDNICFIFNEAVLLSLQSLIDFAIEFVSKYSCKVLKHKSFKQLSADALNEIFTRVPISASDVDVFYKLVGWMTANPSKSAGFSDILENVVLDFLTVKDMTAFPSDVLDAVVHLIRENKTSGRTFCFKNENVAVPKYGVKVIYGGQTSFFKEEAEIIQNDTNESSECANLLVLGYQTILNFFKYFTTACEPPIDEDASFLKHTIGSSDGGIIIDLGHRFELNSFKIQLVGTGKSTSSYVVDVSEDNVNWARVIDHSKYPCRSLQNLYFDPRLVRFIRIWGAGPANRIFKISSFEASYTTESFEVDPQTKLIIPSKNVALKNKAFVQRTFDGPFDASTDSLLQYRNVYYNGYIFQLHQPYLIDSIHFIEEHHIVRAHGYKVEISADKTNWTRVYFGTTYDNIYFKKRPVVFIKITSMFAGRNENFNNLILNCPVVRKK
uniref:BTB domain-containing protein n=1 Tax=Panagrellus redivivus TaxID=6233 RepID=A0A7E4UTN8_PANRE